MVEEGDTAPDFTAPMASPEYAGDVGEYTGDHIEEFVLSEALEEGPVVLAFIPGAFSRTCTEEMCAVRDWRREVGDLGATVVGVSADTPWSQLAFIEEYGLEYPFVSGFNNDLIERYGLAVEGGLLAGIAGRAVFVVDADRTVVYRWDGGSGTLPDLEAVAEAIAAA